ncbi:hypothetical protein J3R03_010086 [Actinoplanes couchii]|uniref:tRNA nuclease CdiA C-terminal domain-containing protein n=2 Tax=Actinoplanes couchii TaxID=403638 RepID=A0ABQ3X8U8_9ACTN|nr:hypothetical protein [Actinoplanes couchii]GID54940.1 hypothetical protein Aco03nite_033440 [Actinoplanes couchii]
MTGKPRDAHSSRPHGHADAVRPSETTAAEVARQGRAGNATGRSSAAAGGRTDDGFTRMTGTPGGRPDGRPVEITPGMLRDTEDRSDNRRSAERENATAAALAEQGYLIKQRPSGEEVARARLSTGDAGSPAKDPDYLIEGRVFDCYSPTPDKPIRGVWWQTQDKVVKEQTQRVVVDLVHWRGDLSALQRQFDDWPIENLKEVKALLPNGETVQIHLPPPSD